MIFRKSLFFLSLLAFSAAGQELHFGNLNANVMLPSQECYKVLQDKEGYIWFSSDRGLCRYSAGNLKVFGRNNGLPEESVYAMEMDKTGRVWFGTATNRILYYEKGKLIEPAFNKEYFRVSNKFSGSYAVINNIYVDDPDYLDVINSFVSVRISRKTGKVLEVKDIPGVALQLKKTSKEQRFVNNRVRLGISVFPVVRLVSGSRTKTSVLSEIDCTKIEFRYVWTGRAHGLDVVSLAKMIYIFREDLSYDVIELPDEITVMRVDKDQGVWVGLRNKGLYYFKDIRTKKITHHSLRDFSVTDICPDNENGVWCSTLEQGVFHCLNKNIQSFVNDGFDKQAVLLKAMQGKLFIGIREQLMFRENGEMKNFRPGFSFTYLYDILFFRNKWYIGGSSAIYRTDKDKKNFEILLRKSGNYISPATGEAFVPYKDKLYVAIHSAICEITESAYLRLLNTDRFGLYAKICDAGDGNLLVGNKQGLYTCKPGDGNLKLLSGEIKDIQKLIRDDNGVVWIPTKSKGIFRYRNGQLRKATELGDFKDVRIFDLAVADDGSLWAGTNRGIYRFRKTGDKYVADNFYVPNGIPSNEVYRIAYFEGEIWFSTFEGLFRITDPEKMNNGLAFRIKTDQVRVNGKVQKNLKNIYLDDHTHPVSILFDLLSYKDLNTNKLSYKLIGSGGNTLTSVVTGSELSFAGLDPDSYKLIVRGVNFDGTESGKPEILYINVAKPFYMSWWFITACIIVLILIFLAILRYFTARIRNREKAKTEINRQLAEFKMTALQAQMNPHFIFNAINTIQGYILQRNEEEAYKYLAKFSKLIRIVLHHSREKELLLSDELEMLNLYIELEQVRFDHSFSYELKIAGNVDPDDTYLPGMLLQPYVENAIWHGLINLREERRGKLIISFERESDHLKVSIEDNGIGRAKAKDYRKNTSHKSVSMDLTSERIQLMKAIYDFDQQSIEIIDKSDNEQKPAGTIVILHIPNIL